MRWWWYGGQEYQSVVGAGLAGLSPVWPAAPAVAVCGGVAPWHHRQENSCLWRLIC